LKKRWNKAILIFVFLAKPPRPYRRMGIALVYEYIGANMDALRKKAKVAADFINIT